MWFRVVCVCVLTFLSDFCLYFQCFQCSCTVILLAVLYLNTGWLSPVILSSFLTVWWLLLFPFSLCYPRLLLLFSFCFQCVYSLKLFRSSLVYSIDDYWFATLLAGSGGDAHPFVNDCLFSCCCTMLNNVYICRHLKKDIWGGFSLKCSVTFSSQVRKRDSLSLNWLISCSCLSFSSSLPRKVVVCWWDVFALC